MRGPSVVTPIITVESPNITVETPNIAVVLDPPKKLSNQDVFVWIENSHIQVITHPMLVFYPSPYLCQGTGTEWHNEQC